MSFFKSRSYFVRRRFYLLVSCAAVTLIGNAIADKDDVIFPDKFDREKRYQTHSYSRRGPTSTSPPPQHRHRSDGFVSAVAADRTNETIPIDLARHLSEITDEKEFLRKFVENGDEILREKTDIGAPLFRSAFPGTRDNNDGDGPRRARYPVPKFAACQPESRTVSLSDGKNSAAFYYPSCVRTELCSGCCSHEALQCQPTRTATVNYTVHVTKYEGRGKFSYAGTTDIGIVKHLACKCDCRVKAADCNELQWYESKDCRCVCRNTDDEQRCRQDATKTWNPSKCTCTCREEYECPNGWTFDQTLCKCGRGNNEEKRSIASNSWNHDNYWFARH